jgi:hypothetical protein
MIPYRGRPDGVRVTEMGNEHRISAEKIHHRGAIVGQPRAGVIVGDTTNRRDVLGAQGGW